MGEKSSSNHGSLTGIAALAVLCVGIFVGTKLKSPGDGGSDAEQGTELTSVTAEEQPTENPPEQPPEPTGAVGPPEMIAVLIRDDAFLVARPDVNGSMAMALPEIADLAKSTVGTEEGIRVRVQRHVSARTGDQQRLYQALTNAGIKPEQLQKISEFVQ